VRVLLEHRQQLLEMRPRAQKGLQALALSHGLRRGQRRWSRAGQQELKKIPLRGGMGLRRAYRRLTFRKGAAVAKVAVARKLAIRLYIMLRDGIDYPEFCRRGSHAGMLGDVALVSP